MLLRLLTIRLPWFSLFPGCFGSVYSYESDLDFYVMAFGLYGIAIVNTSNFELAS